MKHEPPKWAPLVAATILETVKGKDAFTFFHCCRVGRAARKLAKAMGLSEFEQMVLEYSGLFHDVGKVAIPDGVLNKPDRLNAEEVEVMKLHPLKSIEIIEPLSSEVFFRFLMPGVKFHHEKFDGSGYPFGQAGEQIPLTARIIAIVDTVDAMANVRPYRQAQPWEKIKKELQDFSGTQFDKSIVNIYLDAVKFWDSINEPEKDEAVIQTILKAA